MRGSRLFPLASMPQECGSAGVIGEISHPGRLRRHLERRYLALNRWFWSHLPESVAGWRPVIAYGHHLNTLVQRREMRAQRLGTFFFRNRPELELLTRIAGRLPRGSTLDMAIVACSKGPEVYSISYAIRSARPDLILRICAIDIASDILSFAAAGVYSLRPQTSQKRRLDSTAQADEITFNTERDQKDSIFERISPAEIREMFDHDGDNVRVTPRFREGITWNVGDARDPELVTSVGRHDIVIANRFLCHMNPSEAEQCLRNVARLVRPGGYLFASGVDLSVRSHVARELGWRPVTDLIADIHEGDPSLRRDWPLQYWGLEPFDSTRADWHIRYASVFQI